MRARRAIPPVENAGVPFGHLSLIFDKKPARRGETCGNIRRIEVLMARLHDGRSSRPEALDRSVCADWQPNPTTTGLRKNSLPVIAMRLFQGIVLTLCALVGLGVRAFAQTDVNEVHVAPREVEKPKETPKQDLVATSGLSTHVRPLKVDVDLVLVPVTITDPMNRLVTGLEKDNFQLFEGNSAQEIRSFSSEDAPVSLGVIFDSSGSMSSKMERAKEAVVEFFKTANPQDEFFMISFSDEPEEVSDFTSSVDEI